MMLCCVAGRIRGAEWLIVLFVVVVDRTGVDTDVCVSSSSLSPKHVACMLCDVVVLCCVLLNKLRTLLLLLLVYCCCWLLLSELSVMS